MRKAREEDEREFGRLDNVEGSDDVGGGDGGGFDD
jgi:hypothetical protein